MTLEIQTKQITKNVAGLHGLMGSKPPLLITGSPTAIHIHLYLQTMGAISILESRRQNSYNNNNEKPAQIRFHS